MEGFCFIKPVSALSRHKSEDDLFKKKTVMRLEENTCCFNFTSLSLPFQHLLCLSPIVHFNIHKSPWFKYNYTIYKWNIIQDMGGM
jgi:hypothetical protein